LAKVKFELRVIVGATGTLTPCFSSPAWMAMVASRHFGVCFFMVSEDAAGRGEVTRAKLVWGRYPRLREAPLIWRLFPVWPRESGGRCKAPCQEGLRHNATRTATRWRPVRRRRDAFGSPRLFCRPLLAAPNRNARIPSSRCPALGSSR
jgi:hypothetical protein